MLEKYYNKNEISTIEGNTAHKLFLLNNRNQSTVDKINALAGEEEVWYTYENYAYDENGNRYLAGIRRELSTQKVINPKKVRELKKGEGILFCASQPVIDDIKINPWFETERLSKYLDNTFDTEVDDSLNDLIDFSKPNFTSIIASEYLAKKEELKLQKERDNIELKMFEAKRMDNKSLYNKLKEEKNSSLNKVSNLNDKDFNVGYKVNASKVNNNSLEKSQLPSS